MSLLPRASGISWPLATLRSVSSLILLGALSIFLVVSGALPAAGVEANKESVEAAAGQALSGLQGDTGFTFTEIRDGKAVPLFGVRDDRRFAIGSSFKLFILGMLADDVNQDRRQLSNSMLLRTELIGPPSSEMAQWPAGSPVTMHTLALKMIWISDNTATDHLLYVLGRERVEAQMAVMGHSEPAINRPLLSTREMTTLRDKKRDMPGREYAKLDEAGRRAFLAKLVAGPPDYEQLDFDTAAYKVAEWYASPLDMARALAWIYDHTQPGQPAHPLRAVLTVDTKLNYDKQAWPFVGFKGGSEDQLLAGNWLMQNRNGRWYTLHVFWNNPQGPADPEKFVPALGQILAAVESAIK